ncbi:hypothetical protein ACN08N_28010 (plasmid) [Photobacterium leiognathi subsp. mandapamensis]
MIEANQVETSAIGGVSFTRFRLSWVAYLRPLLVLPILLGITFFACWFSPGNHLRWFGVGCVADDLQNGTTQKHIPFRK